MCVPLRGAVTLVWAYNASITTVVDVAPGGGGAHRLSHFVQLFQHVPHVLPMGSTNSQPVVVVATIGQGQSRATPRMTSASAVARHRRRLERAVEASWPEQGRHVSMKRCSTEAW